MFAEFGNPKVEGNTRNYLIPQKVYYLILSLTSKDERRMCLGLQGNFGPLYIYIFFFF